MKRASSKFTLADLDALVAKGNIQGYKVVSGPPAGKPKKAKAPKLPAVNPAGLLHIDSVLKELGLEYVEELQFHPTRKWRFDRALPAHMVALEFEGIFSEKSRHTTVTGYSKDAEKYNNAALLGWRVLRFTALNYRDCRQQLETLLNACNWSD